MTERRQQERRKILRAIGEHGCWNDRKGAPSGRTCIDERIPNSDRRQASGAARNVATVLDNLISFTEDDTRSVEELTEELTANGIDVKTALGKFRNAVAAAAGEGQELIEDGLSALASSKREHPTKPHQCPPLSPELRRMIEAELKGALGFVPEQFQEGYYAALRKLLREADSLASPTGGK